MLNFLVARLNRVKQKRARLLLITYFIFTKFSVSKTWSLQKCFGKTNKWEFLLFFFHTKSLQSDIDFVEAAYLSLDTKFSWERFYLNFCFIKFTIEKVDSHTQIVLKILASDLRAEWNTSSEVLKGRAARSPVPWMQQPHCTRVPETRAMMGQLSSGAEARSLCRAALRGQLVAGPGLEGPGSGGPGLEGPGSGGPGLAGLRLPGAGTVTTAGRGGKGGLQRLCRALGSVSTESWLGPTWKAGPQSRSKFHCETLERREHCVCPPQTSQEHTPANVTRSSQGS